MFRAVVGIRRLLAVFLITHELFPSWNRISRRYIQSCLTIAEHRLRAADP